MKLFWEENFADCGKKVRMCEMKGHGMATKL